MFDKVMAAAKAGHVERGSQDMLDMQDELGRATQREITEFVQGLDRDQRRRFIWVAFVTVDFDSAEHIFDAALVRPAIEKIDQHAAELEMASFERLRDAQRELQDDRLAFEADARAERLDRANWRAAIGRRLRKLSHKAEIATIRLEGTKAELARTRKELAEAQAELKELRKVAEAVATLKGLLK